MGCFSFYPGKNLGAYGDAGAVVLNDDDMAEKVRMLANHGRLAKYGHIYEGSNSRLDGLQGAILSVKLKHLDDWNAARRKVADGYRERLAGPGPGSAGRPPRPRLSPVRNRDGAAGAAPGPSQGKRGGGLHPLPGRPAPAQGLRVSGPQAGRAFPVAEKLAATILSLPIYPEITGEQQDYVADQIKAFFRKG